MECKEDSTDYIFKTSKRHLNKIIKYYKKFNFNNQPVIKGKYYLFIIQIDEIIASYIITLNHKNNEILNYEKKDGEIKKGSLYFLNIVVDVYVELNREEYKIEEICAICYDNKPNIILKPCNHISTCKKCFYGGVIKICPICRTKITQVIKYDILS